MEIPMNKILIVDDDDNLRKSFEKLLKEEGYQTFTAAGGSSGLAGVKAHCPDLVILDVRLPDANGLDVYQKIKKIDNRLPVIIVTAYSTTDTAIEATRMGAFDYIIKPFDIPEVLSTIRRALETGHFIHSPVSLSEDDVQIHQDVIVGQGPKMQNVYKTIGKVAPTNATVLIRGESGTGKELVARALFHYSQKLDNPFKVINCVAIPENLLESELFGHEKGAFTGATNRKIGKIEQAQGGTIFLDEIGDMPMGIQNKLLRLLQEKTIERVGGREIIPVNIRIIAATNRNLENAIKEKTFREDIYFRLKVVTIWLPPLRERQSDIALLAQYTLKKYAIEMSINNPGITPSALETLNSYHWPGNVRELINLIQRVLIFNQGAPISASDIKQILSETNLNTSLPDQISDENLRAFIRNHLATFGGDNLFQNCMDHFSQLIVDETLKMTQGNRTQAAKKLGLSRPTFHAKLDKRS
jgi:nitrogen regulation protein NR(I)